MSEPVELVPRPERGRVFVREREVRLGDADGSGRLRLDALARYLQDVANDDARDALGADAAAWVVRRSVVEVTAWPALGEVLELATFLGGAGPRWAERRTSVVGRRGARIECAALWVHLDMRTGTPAPLPATFLPAYGEVYGSRRVTGRLTLPAPATATGPGRPWQLRSTDFDVMGHVNNAAYWAFVEDAVAGAVPAAPVRFELEYKKAIEPDDDVSILVDRERGLAWLVDAGGAGVRAAASFARSESS